MRKMFGAGEEVAPIGAGTQQQRARKRLTRGKKGAWKNMSRTLMTKVAGGEPLADAMDSTYLEAADRGEVARRDLTERGRNENGWKKGGNSGDAVYRPFTQQAIIASNIECFDAVMSDHLAPYKMLFEAMQTATTTRKRTIREEIEQVDKASGLIIKINKWRDVYEEVPDWPIRKECARTIMMLKGCDPRLVSRIEVNGQTGQINVHIGDLYANIGKAETPQQALDVYNELKRLEQAGETVYFPQSDGSQLIGPIK